MWFKFDIYIRYLEFTVSSSWRGTSTYISFLVKMNNPKYFNLSDINQILNLSILTFSRVNKSLQQPSKMKHVGV